MKAFEEIYQTYQADVRRFLLCLTGYDESLTEELTQEAFYQAFLSLDRFRGECQLRTWLFQIARNIYGKHIRHTVQERQNTDEENIRESADIAENFEHKQQIMHLRDVVSHLEEPARTVVEYRLYSELSYAEIARLLHIRENTASVIFNRAKAKISSYLKEVYHYEI